jgi:uncharacterized ParB-like nuclease family protein
MCKMVYCDSCDEKKPIDQMTVWTDGEEDYYQCSDCK